jgi:hypothetical protein
MFASRNFFTPSEVFIQKKNHKSPKSKHKWSVVYQSLKRGVGRWVRGWVGAQERQDKTQDSRQERTYFYFFPNIFFWPKKSTTHKQKSALS